jgi:hypothetical protein
MEVNWTPLDDAVENEERATKTVAAEAHDIMKQMGGTLRERAIKVHAHLIDTVRIRRELNTIEEWYRTAEWVAENNSGLVAWKVDSTFTDHKMAMRQLTWSQFKTTQPIIRKQGTGRARNWIEQIRTALTNLENGDTMTGTAVVMNSGSRRNTIKKIKALLDKGLIPVSAAVELAETL